MRTAAIGVVMGLMAAMACCGQIHTRSVTSEGVTGAPAQYDSTRNFLSADAHLYKGQSLYLKGLSLKVRGFGYDGFYSRLPEKVGDVKATYKRGAALNRLNSKYESLAFRYFYVMDVVRSAKATSPAYPRDVIYLVLRAKDNSEAVYFEYDPKHEFRFPFVVQAHFAYLENTYKGSKFVVRRVDGLNGLGIVNSKIGFGDTLECTSFFIEDRAYSVVASMKRADGEEIVADPDKLTNETFLFTLEAAVKYVERFGDINYAHIVANRVKAGMTREMCRLSWGEPVSTNRIVHRQGALEQWVYPEEKYLYFESDTLTSTQN